MNMLSLLRRGLWPLCLLTALGTGFAQSPGLSPASARTGLEGAQQLGQPATDIQGVEAGGAAIALSGFRGRVILLDVSTMWCTYCKQDAAPLQYLYRKYGPKGLVVLTCLTEDLNGATVAPAGLREWVETYHLTQPVMNDASGTHGGAAETAYVAVTGGFPTLVLIDRDFNVQYLQGGLDLPGVTAQIEALLAR